MQQEEGASLSEDCIREQAVRCDPKRKAKCLRGEIDHARKRCNRDESGSAKDRIHEQAVRSHPNQGESVFADRSVEHQKKKSGQKSEGGCVPEQAVELE